MCVNTRPLASSYEFNRQDEPVVDKCGEKCTQRYRIGHYGANKMRKRNEHQVIGRLAAMNAIDNACENCCLKKKQ